MRKIAPFSENRILFLRVGENVSAVARDTYATYIAGPIQEGAYGRLLFGVPLTIINGTNRLVDAVLTGVVDQELSVPSGHLAELSRDTRFSFSHLFSLKPFKFVTDVFRVGGSTVSGVLDSATGFTKHSE